MTSPRKSSLKSATIREIRVRWSFRCYSWRKFWIHSEIITTGHILNPRSPEAHPSRFRSTYVFFTSRCSTSGQNGHSAAERATVFVSKPARLDSVDFLRGGIMIIMALDHVRDYVSGFPYSPTDLAHTTPALFFTRWITHFCAPIFIFLAGTGSFLSLGRGKTTRELSRFLLTRGLFLLVLEQTVMRLGWNFRLGAPLWSGILFAIGMSMIVLAGMIDLPRGLMIGISLAMVLLHNTLDGFHAEFLGSARWLWAVLHESGNFGHYADGAVVSGCSTR